jgi:hypothetical protein
MSTGADLYAAKQLWDSGAALEAGRLLFETIPPLDRPQWAAGLLDLCCALLRSPPVEVLVVRTLATDPDRWSEGHSAFDAVRDLVLREEARVFGRNKILLEVLFVAENTARIIYNASAPPDPFDADSGWWLAENLRSLSNCIADEAFRAEAWRRLSTVPTRGRQREGQP